MTPKGAYRCFFETYNKLEDNRQQQSLLLKPKFFVKFDNDTKRMLEEKSKVLRWVVDSEPDLWDNKDCCAVVVNYRKDTLREYKLLENSVAIENELVKLIVERNCWKKLKAENVSYSEKQILCNQAERLWEKLDEICAESLRIMKTEVCLQGFANFSNARSYYRDLVKQYRLSKDCGNQTSLVSSTSAADKGPNETAIDIGNGALENAEGNVGVSSRHSATQGSRKQPSIANTRSSRRTDWRNRAQKPKSYEKKTEQQLRQRQLDLEQERQEIEFCTSKDATKRRRTASSTAWAGAWKRKKESRGRQRTKTSET